MRTTEETLNLIKVINEEKDLVEDSISELNCFKNTAVEVVSLHMGVKAYYFTTIPAGVAAEVIDVLERYYQERKDVLIKKAEALINSDADNE